MAQHGKKGKVGVIRERGRTADSIGSVVTDPKILQADGFGRIRKKIRGSELGFGFLIKVL